MKEFELGQKVMLIDEVFEGMVVEISKSYLIVRDANGFDFKIEKCNLIPSDKNNLMQKACQQHIVNKDEIQYRNQSIYQNLQPKANQKGVLEVDLHIEQLIQQGGGVFNNESLPTQLEYAAKTLDLFVKRGYSKIVFIHGVGEGKLKAALHQLFRKHPVSWHDADFRKYGVGATEVVLNSRKNQKNSF